MKTKTGNKSENERHLLMLGIVSFGSLCECSGVKYVFVVYLSVILLHWLRGENSAHRRCTVLH